MAMKDAARSAAISRRKFLKGKFLKGAAGTAALLGAVRAQFPGGARPRKRLALAADPTYLRRRQRVLEFLYERHRFVEAA